ncbi:MAG: fibronectin type III domain-containing protein, partial [Acidimicrobiales bacterium]
MTRFNRKVFLAGVALAGGLVGLGAPAVALAATASQGSTSCTQTGTIQVTDTDNDTVMGFVSSQWNSFGEFGVTTNPSDYLSVSLPVGNQVEITATNGLSSTYPLVGGVDGFVNTNPNLAPGTYNYAYLGGTTTTAPGATPALGPNSFTNSTGDPEDIESSIWSLGPNDSLTPQWVNTDSSTPATYLLVYSGILLMTGDTTQFQDTFGAAADVSLTLRPSGAQCTQSISFNSTPVATVGGPPYAPQAFATSGLPVTYSIDGSSTTGACSATGGVVSFTGLGTCVVDANQSGDASYLAAPQVQQPITVGLGLQSVSFSSSPPGDATVGGATYSPSATATSGLPVSFSIDATSTAGACSVAAGVVSFTGAGTCVLDAGQPGDTQYLPAATVDQDIGVGPGSQSISFTSAAPTDATVGGASYQPEATASSNLPVSFSIDGSSTIGACSVTAGIVSFAGTGTCVVDANQSGNANYLQASTVAQAIEVGPASQSIVIRSAAPDNATVGGASYTPVATASSELAVSFSIDAASTAETCSIGAGVISFTGIGTCVVDANQSGNADYLAAPQQQQAIAVGPGAQAITFTSSAPSDATVGGASYTATATASSDLTVSFSIDPSSTAGACSISDGVVSFTGAGACVVDANQAGSANYLAAAQMDQPITVGRGSQSISFTSAVPTDPTVRGASYMPAATATSRLAVAFSIGSTSSRGACSISGTGVVSFTAAGSCVVDANQSGSADYLAAPQVAQTLTVSARRPSAPTSLSATAGADEIALSWSPPSFSGGEPIVGYRVLRGTASGSEGATPIATVSTASYLDAAVVPGIKYYYEIEALNEVGASTRSTQASAEVEPTPAGGDRLAASPDGGGWWVLNPNGTVSTFGDAKNYGSTVSRGLRLSEPPVGITATADGRGYWIVSAAGGVYPFGDAKSYGSEAGRTLTRPIVGLVSTRSGHGYWLFASDGGVFTFGDAHFYGSEGGTLPGAPVIAMASTADGRGYWLAFANGGVKHFGDAGSYGSARRHGLTHPIVGVTRSPLGRGYWLVTSSGEVFAFGDAHFYGSESSTAQTHAAIGLIAAPADNGYTIINSVGAPTVFP